MDKLTEILDYFLELVKYGLLDDKEENTIELVGNWKNRAWCPCGYSVPFESRDSGDILDIYRNRFQVCPQCAAPVAYNIRHEGYTIKFYTDWVIRPGIKIKVKRKGFYEESWATKR